MRVAVIGAGPCGLAQLEAFEAARRDGVAVPEVVCFEKQPDWGGLWRYDWRTGTDGYGDPVHAGQYRHLWSNGPKECLEFANYSFEQHFGRQIPSFPPRAALHDYILGRAQASGVRRHIRFDSPVRWVAAADGGFAVTVESRAEGSTVTEHFDRVIVASGHFSTPNVPTYPGFDTFPGRILHSHDFREAREFTGKRLLVLGSSYSAEDIALQTRKFGAASVTIAYRHAPMGFDWPDGIREVPALDHVDGATAHHVDGSSHEVDAIILCTGYRHWFPFLEDGLRLRTDNVLYPPSLYKGVVWTANPELLYLGMQDQYYTFTMFDAQAWWARDLLLGRITLPAPAEMDADIQGWRDREGLLEGPADQIDFQTDYVRDLLREVDYPAFDLEQARKHFLTWEHHKDEDIVGYRDHAFTSPCTGTEAPLPATPWWANMDDSLAAFLRR